MKTVVNKSFTEKWLDKFVINKYNDLLIEYMENKQF
jgi:hypothetical protein